MPLWVYIGVDARNLKVKDHVFARERFDKRHLECYPDTWAVNSRWTIFKFYIPQLKKSALGFSVRAYWFVQWLSILHDQWAVEDYKFYGKHSDCHQQMWTLV